VFEYGLDTKLIAIPCVLSEYNPFGLVNQLST
jgi:hypothetical protein